MHVKESDGLLDYLQLCLIPLVSPHMGIGEAKHRQTGQRSDSIGRTVLQTIAQQVLLVVAYFNK